MVVAGSGASAANHAGRQMVRQGGIVDIRYLGFQQRQNARAYQFDVRDKGQPTRQFTVTADLDLFRIHGLGIQEGPGLSGTKLAADLEKGWEGEHELTGADVRAFVDNRSLAEAHRAEMRKKPRARPAPLPDAEQKSPWRNFGI